MSGTASATASISRVMRSSFRSLATGREHEKQALETSLLETLGEEALRYVGETGSFPEGQDWSSLTRGSISYLPVVRASGNSRSKSGAGSLASGPQWFSRIARDARRGLSRSYSAAAARSRSSSTTTRNTVTGRGRIRAGGLCPGRATDPFVEAIRSAQR